MAYRKRFKKRGYGRRSFRRKKGRSLGSYTVTRGGIRL